MVATLKSVDAGMAANDAAGSEVAKLSVTITAALVKQVARAAASDSDRYIQDSEVAGFKLLRRKGEGKPRLSFVFIGRVKGAGKVLKVTLGPAFGRGAMNVTKARAEALRHSEACREGRNRVAEQKERNAVAAATASDAGRRQWTIAYAFDDFLRYRREVGQRVEKLKLRPATEIVYSRCIRNVTGLAKRPVLEVSKQEIQNALMKVATVSERAKVRRVLSLTITHAFDRLNVEDRVNPVSKLARGLFAAPAARETYLEESVLGNWVARLMEVRNERDQRLAATAGNLALTLLLYGLRYNEAAMMEWNWFDKDETRFTVPANVSKTKQARTLPVTTWMTEVLEVQRATCASLKDQHGTYPRFVFPGRSTGERMKDIRAAMATAGCHTYFPKPEEGGEPSFRPHDLRRTFATHFAAQVSDGARLKWVLGHTAKDVTDKYIRPSPDQMARDLEQYQEWLAHLAEFEILVSDEQRAEWAAEHAAEMKSEPPKFRPVVGSAVQMG